MTTSPKISVLKSAHTAPICVSNSDRLDKATTLMQMHGYSQLPVMNGSQNVLGYISWETIGTALVNGVHSDMVKDYVNRSITKLDLDFPLIEAIEKVRERDFAVVINEKKELCGIITTADITSQFLSTTSPFVYIEQIESLLRLLLKDTFLVDDLRNVCKEEERAAKITSVDDLTFGEYLQLIANEGMWSKLKLDSVDRKIFLKQMDSVRQIRNEVMHFEPAGITAEQAKMLRETSAFLSNLVSLKEKRLKISNSHAKGAEH